MDPRHTLTRSVPSLDEQEFLEDRLYEYNRDQTGRDDGELFAFFIRDAGTTGREGIVAGIAGWTWAGASEIRTLWVHAGWRGQGYGRQLLQAAEAHALGRGCRVIFINSYSFQAPGFYQKNGYELAWELPDFPPGHRYCFLVKRFDELEAEVEGKKA